MKRRIAITLLALSAAITLRGQGSISQTIQVTNSYEADAPAAAKEDLPMVLPDSLLRFDLDYNYTVFDNPYQGSYQFKPYLIGIQPEIPARKGRLYVKAGAGYELHPLLDVIWAPRSRYDLQVTARHQSYFGNYKTFALVPDATGGTFEAQDATWRGRDMENAFTVSGATGGDDWALKLSGGISNISAKDQFQTRDFYSGALKAAIGGTDSNAPFLWQAALGYRYSRDEMERPYGESAVNETDVRFDGSFGPVVGDGQKVLVDVAMEIARYGGGFIDSHVGIMSLRPRYIFERGAWKFTLGAEFSTFIHQDHTEGWFGQPVPGAGVAGLGGELHDSRWYVPVPVASASYALIEDALEPYVFVTGGATVNTWSTLVEGNHFRYFEQMNGRQGFLDNSFEPLRAALGIRGRILHRFAYDLSGGYARMNNALSDCISTVTDIPTFGYVDGENFFADLRYSLITRGFETSGQLSFRNVRYNDWGVGDLLFLAPGHFSGNLSAGYNYRGRIKAGLSCVFESQRSTRGNLRLKVPGWVDLGIDAGYVLTPQLSLWLRGGNLLCQPVQRVLLHAETAPFVQAGIVFKL